jgi:outer membrane receptor protein involved in Fe transport
MLPDESAEVVKGDDDYVTLLPSLIVNYQLREDVILRSAITRALGRADYDVIAPRSSYEEEAAQGELVIGNPGLEPRESWNFDMAIEWYPNEMSLFYQTQSVDMALSYTYNDSFLTDINDSPAEDLDQGEFGRWDFKASWIARENLKLFFEAVNLNNEPTTEFQGGRTRQNTEHEYVGRTLYLGVSYGF